MTVNHFSFVGLMIDTQSSRSVDFSSHQPTFVEVTYSILPLPIPESRLVDRNIGGYILGILWHDKWAGSWKVPAHPPNLGNTYGMRKARRRKGSWRTVETQSHQAEKKNKTQWLEGASARAMASPQGYRTYAKSKKCPNTVLQLQQRNHARRKTFNGSICKCSSRLARKQRDIGNGAEESRGIWAITRPHLVQRIVWARSHITTMDPNGDDSCNLGRSVPLAARTKGRVGHRWKN
ncbi:hypothetical protein DSL72_003146 [Monilinia vaccinii-corymbosi]|uniref:Uncharacterized protein n=1 Tax=Monilinia vaccinii-corymbosi TaxID=61207 RepID=A0A8A3P8R2_9HELO|nr:hypothetical protein DSL72_003146 [Monilinia vaccinii-corymbosi]